MKQLNNYISEKLILNKSIVSPNNEKIMLNNISKYLSDWLLKKDTYKGVTNYRYEFLKYFNNEICDLIDYFTGEFEEMSERLQIEINKLSKLIQNHNDEILKYCKKEYLDYHNTFPY